MSKADAAPAGSVPERDAAQVFLGALLLIVGLLTPIREGPRGASAALVLLGLVLVAWAWGERARAPWCWLEAGARWLAGGRRQAVLLVASVVLAAGAYAAAGDGLLMRAPRLALLLWGAAIGAAVAGARDGRCLALGRREALLLLGLTVAALALRVWRIDRIPRVLTGDEAGLGLSALEVLEGRADNPFRVLWFSFPSLHSAIQAAPIWLLGRTTAALRLSSAIVGALTVPAVYWLGREIAGRRVGLLSALCLVGLHYHIHFSRIGLNNVWDGLFGTLVLAGVLHAERSGSRWSYGLAGLSLGLAQYFYATARLLPVLLLMWVLGLALLSRRRLARMAPGLVVMLFCALAVCLPLAWYFGRHPGEFMAPVRRVALEDAAAIGVPIPTDLAALRDLLGRVWRAVGALFHIPLTFWYLPGVPMLRPVAAALGLVGVLGLLTRHRGVGSGLLGIALVGALASTALSESPTAAQRFIVVAPWAAVLVGVGLDALRRDLARLWPGLERWAWALALAAAVGLAASDAHFYLARHAPRDPLGGPNTRVAQHLADALRDAPPTTVYFWGWPRMGYRSVLSGPYLNPHVTGIDLESGEQPPECPDRPGVLAVALPEHRGDLDALAQQCPGGTMREATLDGESLYYLYEAALPRQPSPAPAAGADASARGRPTPLPPPP